LQHKKNHRRGPGRKEAKSLTTRKALSKKTRFEVFKRDGFACQYCGAHPPKVILHVDHIVAVANGGGGDMDNLVTSCESCNQGKAARALSSVPQSLKDKSAEVAEREEQLRGYHDILEAKRERLDEESWVIAEILEPGSGDKGFNRDWRLSIKRFIDKLGYHEVIDAAEIAGARKPHSLGTRFRYFCGICWRKIEEGGA
jgi:hypothetical protein